jgi:16S rRNA (cytosine967-C5)-methyltransferase
MAARQVATRLLAAVIDRKTSLDGMLDATGGNAAYLALSEADRALARAIVTTVLRRRSAIDAVLGRGLERPLPGGARNLRFILEAAMAQILFLDVPDRAAVDLAVEQAGADPRSRRFAGLVNAVLRRISREREALLVSAGSAADAVPGWFRARLDAAYGPARSDILAMLAEPPTIDLTVKADSERWAERLGGIVLPTGSVRLVDPEGAVSALAGYAEGAWWVQDAAAAIPARLFGDLHGKHVGDLCAAPGGKTAQLILAGAHVTALDRSGSRLQRLKANLDRLGFEAECIEADLMAYRPAEKFDAVLLDAPCSSTGTVRRHPDVLWTKDADEVARLASLQERLLRHALTLVKPGGRLVFSNCSLDPEEGDAVVARVLSDRADVRIEPVAPARLPGLEEAVQADGTVRTTPAMLPRSPARLGGLDGFYAAMLRVGA